MKDKTRRGLKAAGIAGLAGLACAGILTAASGDAMAYFTTYANAKGGYTLELETHTELHEEFKDMQKTITVENTGETDCYVRVKIIAPTYVEFPITITQGAGWTKSGDYYYYDSYLAPGETTKSSVVAAIGNIPEKIDYTWNVVVASECCQVIYAEDGVTPLPATEASLWAKEFHVEEE